MWASACIRAHNVKDDRPWGGVEAVQMPVDLGEDLLRGQVRERAERRVLGRGAVFRKDAELSLRFADATW